MTRFPEVSAPLLAALRGGDSWPAACASVGVSRHTARAWLVKGRQGPDGPYGTFARDVAAARAAAREPDASEGALLTLGEVERHLAAAVRAGSVTAIALWLKHHAKPGEGERPADPLARFDELARKRRARGA